MGIPSQQTYANYEAGRIPKVDVLLSIAQHCGVTAAWLLGDADNKAELKTTGLLVAGEESPPCTSEGAWHDTAVRLAESLSKGQAMAIVRDLLAQAEQGDRTSLRTARFLVEHFSSRCDFGPTSDDE